MRREESEHNRIGGHEERSASKQLEELNLSSTTDEIELSPLPATPRKAPAPARIPEVQVSSNQVVWKYHITKPQNSLQLEIEKNRNIQTNR